MPRWTRDTADIDKIALHADFIDRWGYQKGRVSLIGSGTVDGTILPGKIANNAGEGGNWTYSASIVVRTARGEVEIDFLDVVTVLPLSRHP